MAGPLLADRVRETSTTTGTGTLNLAGAVAGFQGFVAGIGSANTCFYFIANQTGTEWEVGVGTVTDASPDTLSRDKILASSNAGAAVNFSAGTKDVVVTIPAAIADVDPGICEGRLTLTSGTPVTTADVTAATSVYFAPYKGNRIALYNGNCWVLKYFSELTLALGTLTNDLPYDVYIYDNAGTLTLEALAWTNGTTRATAIVLQDGVYCKTGALTRRLLGTFRTSSTTTTEDSVLKRFLSNLYNEEDRALFRVEDTFSWTIASPTYAQANSSSANQVAMVCCVPKLVNMVVSCVGQGGGANGAFVALGVDSTSVRDAAATVGYLTSVTPVQAASFLRTYLAAGNHYVAWINRSQASDTSTFYGLVTSGQPYSAMSGSIKG